MATYIERPISLHGVLATAAARSTTPALDFEWEPFKANLREFLTLVSGPCVQQDQQSACLPAVLTGT